MSEKSLRDKRIATTKENEMTKTARGSVFNSAANIKRGAPHAFVAETERKFSMIFATKKLSAVARYVTNTPSAAPAEMGNARRTNQIAYMRRMICFLKFC